MLALSSLALALSFDGRFISGSGDGVFLSLLDAAARQHSTDDVELQTVLQLYRGDWDGLTEGTGWAAWWTQNSFGPTMAALPLMPPLEYAAVQHSQAWWFNSIANGSNFGKTGGAEPAPDGCLCDAALPCSDNECAYYKQGDGNVPRHDWTFEESLSAVLMQAEMLLISRNVTGASQFMPLFMRTAAMLEARRDPQTAYTTFLTGPSSNLLAPSFGGGPNGSQAWLTGVSVTYTAALDRMIQLAALIGSPRALVVDLERRRSLNLQGLLKRLLNAPGSAVGGKRYFARSVDPATGVRHGVLGAPAFGYFEASPNHDAVAWRIVDDALAEEIMGTIDALGPRLTPNGLILPNTDAGGGVGYDDMVGLLLPLPQLPSLTRCAAVRLGKDVRRNLRVGDLGQRRCLDDSSGSCTSSVLSHGPGRAGGRILQNHADALCEGLADGRAQSVVRPCNLEAHSHSPHHRRLWSGLGTAQGPL